MKPLEQTPRKRLMPPSNSVASKGLKHRRYNTTATSQRASILHWFSDISPRLSTIDAREAMGIMSPASRIYELRNMGHEIILEWERQQDTTGTVHKVGVYIYLNRLSEVRNV